MIAAILLTIIPTLLMGILLPKFGIKIKSIYLRFTFSWFAGIYCFTFLTFLFAILYSFFTTAVLLKATFSVLLLCEIAILFCITKLKQKNHVSGENAQKQSLLNPVNLFFILFCFLFSYLFFAPHLATNNGRIYTSPIYWDFHWHAAVIQNFTYGDNFPPQNESFPGAPMTYHFFGDLIMAIYESVGIPLTSSITLTSILFLFFMLLTIIGICEEFFSQRWIGFLAVCLSITQSSGHFIDYFATKGGESFSQIIFGILSNSGNPWYTSFIPGNMTNYQGDLFNLFFFLEERHMLLAPTYLLLCLWIIYNRESLTEKTLLILGALMGAFFYWNMFVTIMLVVGLFTYTIITDKKRSSSMLLLGCMLVMGIQYVTLKDIMQNAAVYIPGMINYPRFNPTYGLSTTTYSLGEYLTDFFKFYGYGYGLKAILAPLSLFLLWKKNKRLAVLLIAFTLPIFIIINIFQISPSGVGDSHPILLTIVIILNLTVAGVLFQLFSKKLLYKLIGILFLFLLTISGIIENAPFINSRPTSFYANYSPSSLALTIRAKSDPRAIFVGQDEIAIHLAGRKMFVGESAGPSLALNTVPRYKIVAAIYQTQTLGALCGVVVNTPIDYIEFNRSDSLFEKILINNTLHSPGFTAQHKNLIFLNSKKQCEDHKETMLQ